MGNSLKAKKERLKAELLIDRGVVRKEEVFTLLSGGNILSYPQILEGFGVPLRSIAEEFKHMDEIRARMRNKERVTFDRHTSLRLCLIDILDDATRANVLSKAWSRQGEKRVACYFLTREREHLLESGTIRTQEESFVLGAILDLEERREMLGRTRGRRVERIA